MWSRFRKFFQPPVYDDPELTRRAQNLQVILVGLLMATILWAWYPIFVQGGIQIAVALTVLGLEIGLFILLKAGKVRLASSLISSILWLALLGSMAAFGGIRNSGFVTFTIVVVIATLTMGARAGHTFTTLTIIAGIGLIMAENRGWLPPYAYEPGPTILMSHSMNLIGVSLLLFLSMRNLNKAILSASENERAQKEINKLLEANQAELEHRTETLEQRNKTLETVAEVAKLTSQSKSESTLLQKAAEVIARNSSLDHISIYLLDQTGETAIAQAVYNRAGAGRDETQEYLKVQKSKIHRPLFIANALHYQIGDQNFYIQHPLLLPETKTNITIPLKSGNNLLGLINVQTMSPTLVEFDEQALQTLADQISLSVENTRLFEQLQTRIKEASILAGQTTETAWDKLREEGIVGYKYNRLAILPAREDFPDSISDELKKGKVVAYQTVDTAHRARLAAPILLREYVIGVIGYENNDSQHVWDESEKSLLATVASRVSLALENSRLVAESERHARQERAVSQAANKMRETLDLDTILKTAVIEIKHTLNAEKAEIRLLDLASIAAVSEEMERKSNENQ